MRSRVLRWPCLPAISGGTRTGGDALAAYCSRGGAGGLGIETAGESIFAVVAIGIAGRIADAVFIGIEHTFGAGVGSLAEGRSCDGCDSGAGEKR